jgi:hypothetical protein
LEGRGCPLKGRSSPLEGSSHPFEGRCRSLEGRNCPLKGGGGPLKGGGCPAEGRCRPLEGRCRPVEGGRAPIAGILQGWRDSKEREPPPGLARCEDAGDGGRRRFYRRSYGFAGRPGSPVGAPTSAGPPETNDCAPVGCPCRAAPQGGRGRRAPPPGPCSARIGVQASEGGGQARGPAPTSHWRDPLSPP